MKKRSGFTLVELLVVIIIVGVLASISIPMVSTELRRRAILTEAITALSMIRNAERAYSLDPANNEIPYLDIGYGNIATLPGVSAGELQGTYFSEEFYGVETNPEAIAEFFSSGSPFMAMCTVMRETHFPAVQAPRHNELVALLDDDFWARSHFLVAMDMYGGDC